MREKTSSELRSHFFLIYRMYRRSGVESEIFVSFFFYFQCFRRLPSIHISSLRHIFSRSHVVSPYILMCATVDYLVYNTTATATATKFISSFLHATISSLKDMHMGCAVWWDQITYINLYSSSISVSSCFLQEKKNDAVMKSRDKTWVWLAPTIRRESWNYIVITTWTLIKLEDVRLLFDRNVESVWVSYCMCCT